MLIPATAKGRINVTNPGEVVTAAGPLSGVSLRVTARDAKLVGLTIKDADTSTRPAIVDASGSINLLIDGCDFTGSAGKQQQGVYASAATNLRITNTRIGKIGVHPLEDHAVYLAGGTFAIDACEFYDCLSAGLQLYPGNAKGTIANSILRGNNWGVVSWGAGNDVTVQGCRIFGQHGSRGMGVQASNSGKATVKGSVLYDNAGGNLVGAADGGGNTFTNTTPTPTPTPTPVVDIVKLAEAISTTSPAIRAFAIEAAKRITALEA